MKNIRNFEVFGPRYLHIDLTSLCNLKCLHCRNTSKFSKGELSLKELKSLISESIRSFPNFKHVLIGGGEPTIKKEFLLDFLKFLKLHHISASLNTNATLINDEYARELSPYLKGVQVSLDGVTSKTNDLIRGKGSFDKILSGIKSLSKYNIKIILRMTLSNKNYPDALKLVKFAKDLGVEGVSFYRVLPVGFALKNKAFIQKKDYLNFMNLLSKLQQSEKKLKILSSDPIFLQFNKKLSIDLIKYSGNHKCISGCLPGSVEIFVNNIGNVYPCTMLPLYLGNIKKDSLKNIWNNSLLKNLRNRDNLNGICSSCSLKNLCGGCRAASLGILGDLYGEDPYCPLSKKEINPLHIKSSLDYSPCNFH